jgi:glucose/arabinose dehydrogenase
MKPARQIPAKRVCTVLTCGAALALAGCNDGSGDPKTEIGANPTLPALQQFLLPPMHLARGWKQGEKPSVPNDLKIQPLATGLEHPRSLYVLPNGDVLVVESKAPPAPSPKRPKEIVMAWVEYRHGLGRIMGDLRRQQRPEQPHHAAA